MNNKKNVISAIILQVISIISGLILPRLIISSFGSEVNGLVSSITQFLSFITLLEGGLGAVVLADLYKPIEDKNEKKIHEILDETQNFFNKLSCAFVVYSILLAIIFPFISETSFSFEYISSLVIILSFATLIKYLFSITYRLFLQANQKVYIVNFVSSIIIILNLLFAFIIIKVYPEIHILKICADILFLLQPIVFHFFVDKRFHIKFAIRSSNRNVLGNRWSGFAQNFAHFINMNTDIAVITIISGLKQVSVYTVYMLAINALRSFISLISNSYQSVFGKYYAENNLDKLNKTFIKFEKLNWIVSLVVYCTCLLLINPFVHLYTAGVNDTNYYQPIFAAFIIFANMIYCICEPKRYVVLAAGKFKEINKAYILEASINIFISIILAIKFGIIGVAFGTLIAVLYKFVYFTNYLKQNVLKININYYYPYIFVTIFIVVLNLFVYNSLVIECYSLFTFFAWGLIITVVQVVIVLLLFYLTEKIIKKGDI